MVVSLNLWFCEKIASKGLQILKPMRTKCLEYQFLSQLSVQSDKEFLQINSYY